MAKKTAKKTTAKVTRKKAPAKATPKTIVLPQISTKRVSVAIRGTSPLVQHRFSDAAKQEMALKQQGGAKMKKPPKDPMSLYKASMYLDPKGKPCIPAIHIKSALVGAARFTDTLKMNHTRMALFVVGEHLPLDFESQEMREDVVRINMGKTDLRYRVQYNNWSSRFTIEYNSNFLSLEQVYNLVQLAGFSVGIAEGRPEKSELGGGRFEPVFDECYSDAAE